MDLGVRRAQIFKLNRKDGGGFRHLKRGRISFAGARRQELIADGYEGARCREPIARGIELGGAGHLADFEPGDGENGRGGK